VGAVAVRADAIVLLALVSAAPLALGAAALYYPGDVLWTVFVNKPVAGLAWSPDGGLLAASYPGGVSVYYANGSLAWSVEVEGEVSGAAWAPLAWWPSGLVVVGAGESLVAVNSSGVAWSVELGSRVTAVAWWPSSVVAAALENGSVATYAPTSGELVVVRVSDAPLTAVAWTPGGLLAGDAEGRVYLVSGGEVVASERVGSAVLGLATGPDVYSVAFTTPEAVGVVRVAPRGALITASLDLAAEGFEARGPPAWGPCGLAVAVPAGSHLLVVDVGDSAPLGVAAAFEKQYGYLYEWAAWNPARGDLLAAAGVDPGAGYTRLYALYSGSVVRLEAEPPVQAFCPPAGDCSDVVELNAVGPLELALIAYVDEWGVGARELVLPANITVRPARVVSLTGLDVVLEGAVAVPEDRALLLVLTAPEASVEVRRVPGGPSQALETPALLAPPGNYQVTVQLAPPENWLGPDWALRRGKLLLLAAGQLRVLDYTQFTLESIVAYLAVDTEPGATITLYLENDTVSGVVEEARAEYTVPSGSYTVELTLPQAPNVLAPSREAISYRVAANLYPGDKLILSLKYSDVLGKIVVLGPEAALVEILPPWPSEPWRGALEGGRVELLAAPATYTARATLQAPPGWVGPEPPTVEANVTVPEAGAVVEWNVYHYPEVLEWLSLVEQAAVISVRAPVGFPVIVAYDNVTVEAGRGSVNLTAPPGEYVIRLVDPHTGEVLDEETIRVEAGGEYSVVLEFPAATTTQAPQPTAETPRDGGAPLALIAAAIAPLAAAAAAILYLRRRPR